MTEIHTHACGARWTGHGRAHCAGCHETFTSETAWRRHRRRFQCLDPAEVGLTPKDTPLGRLWSIPKPSRVIWGDTRPAPTAPGAST